jgi:hypothetical protein
MILVRSTLGLPLSKEYSMIRGLSESGLQSVGSQTGRVGTGDHEREGEWVVFRENEFVS